MIEKFEAYSDVGFVFVLLAPDEVACLAAKAGLDEPSEPLRDVRDRMSSLSSGTPWEYSEEQGSAASTRCRNSHRRFGPFSTCDTTSPLMRSVTSWSRNSRPRWVVVRTYRAGVTPMRASLARSLSIRLSDERGPIGRSGTCRKDAVHHGAFRAGSVFLTP